MPTIYDYVTSIHGKRLALDHSDNILAEGLRLNVTEGTSANQASVDLANQGHITLAGSNASTFTLTDPVAGCQVSITNITTSVKTILPDNATIISSNGIAGSSMTLTGIGAGFELVGVSTAQWMVTSKTASTAGTLVGTVSS